VDSVGERKREFWRERATQICLYIHLYTYIYVYDQIRHAQIQDLKAAAFTRNQLERESESGGERARAIYTGVYIHVYMHIYIYIYIYMMKSDIHK